MTDEEIIQKAVEKAIKNGWEVNRGAFWIEGNEVLFSNMQTSDDIIKMSFSQVIFNHDFAKAFWGINIHWLDKQKIWAVPEWQFHLQQTSILENNKQRLRYLKKFL